MANPLSKFINPAGNGFVPRALRFTVGVAMDFWKDGSYQLPKYLGFLGQEPDTKRAQAMEAAIPHAAPSPASAPAASAASPASSAVPPAQVWRAAPGEVAEKMWGKGSVLPAGDALADMMTVAFKLEANANILDLHAGLGGQARRLAEKFKANVTGLEPDADIAKRGMELSAALGKGGQADIVAYDPLAFTTGKQFDAIVARELFYRITGKNKFFTSIAACLKPKGQLAFVDYILEDADKAKPAVAKWLSEEKDAVPLPLAEVGKGWEALGMQMQASEDQTAFYRREIMLGLQRLMADLSHAWHPDAATKAAILQETESWMRRAAALEQGLKFYRFQAVKR